jgi:hypothetical protein
MQRKEKTANTMEKAIKHKKEHLMQQKNMNCNIKKSTATFKNIHYNIGGESAAIVRKSYYNISSTINAT